MLKNSFTYSNSTANSTPDLLANHKTEQTQKSQKHLEDAILDIVKDLEDKAIETKKILENGGYELKKVSEKLLEHELMQRVEGMLFKRVTEIIQKLHKKEQEVSLQFKAMTENIEKLTDFSRESAITKVSPERILKYLRLHAAYKQMNPDEEKLFLEIEWTLSNTSIIKAMPSEVIVFQLGVLGVEYQKNNLISPTLFHNLTLMRIEQAPDRLKLNEINGSLYKLSSLEMCQSADKYLADKASYNISKTRFNQRLQGLAVEILQEQSTKKHTEQHLNESLNCTLNFLEKETEEILVGQLSKLTVATESLSTLKVPAKPLSQPEEPKTCHYLLEKETIDFMLQLLPEHKKYEFIIDEISSCKLHELMQASLSSYEKSDSIQEQFTDQQFIAKFYKTATEAFHKCQEKMQSAHRANYQYLLLDVIANIKTLLKSYEESKKQRVDSCLQGEELLTAYIKKMQRFMDSESDSLDRKYFDEKATDKNARYFYQSKSPSEKDKKEIYQKTKETNSVIKINFNKLINFVQMNLNKEVIIGLKFPNKATDCIVEASAAYLPSNEPSQTPNSSIASQNKEYKNQEKPASLYPRFKLTNPLTHDGSFICKDHTEWREHLENTPISGSYKNNFSNF